MIEIKQLKYFVITVDKKSISEAARALYTSQSSVSKVLSSLENSLGYTLINREKKGVTLTAKGLDFYKNAKDLVNRFEQLENLSASSENRVVRVATNSSSWFANLFSEFYGIHDIENIRYNIHTDSTYEIIKRVKNMIDEVGFVYVMPEKYQQFIQDIENSNIEYMEFCVMDGAIYFTTEDSSEKACELEMDYLKYIQAEEDEFSRCSGWIYKGNSIGQIDENDIAISTNSDYIMNVMLKKHNLANISPNIRSYSKAGNRLKNRFGGIHYGVIYNRDNIPGSTAAELIEFVKAHC